MYLCYFDESGDPGYKNSLTHAFALACVVVHDTAWLSTLDQIISFRRFLRDEFKIPMRAELKAGYFIHNTGPFENLNIGPETRMKIYRMSLRLEHKIGLETFAIVVDKDQMVKQYRTGEEPQRRAWELAYERLETLTRKRNDTCLVFPDEGTYEMIRSVLREKRRHNVVPSHYGTQGLSRPASFVIEDPSVRRSSESYFIQFADFSAYAAHRRVKPAEWCGTEYWEHLGQARLRDVSWFTDDPVGIKVWPPTRKKEKPPFDRGPRPESIRWDSPVSDPTLT